MQTSNMTATRFGSIPASFFASTFESEEDTSFASHGSAKGQGVEAVKVALQAFIRCAQVWIDHRLVTDLDLGQLLPVLVEKTVKARALESSWWIDATVLTVGSVTTMRWNGCSTVGRYIEVILDTATMKVSLEWDTATGKESSFMGLPSAVFDSADLELVDVVLDVHIEADTTSVFGDLLSNF